MRLLVHLTKKKEIKNQELLPSLIEMNEAGLNSFDIVENLLS